MVTRAPKAPRAPKVPSLPSGNPSARGPRATGKKTQQQNFRVGSTPDTQAGCDNLRAITGFDPRLLGSMTLQGVNALSKHAKRMQLQVQFGNVAVEQILSILKDIETIEGQRQALIKAGFATSANVDRMIADVTVLTKQAHVNRELLGQKTQGKIQMIDAKYQSDSAIESQSLDHRLAAIAHGGRLTRRLANRTHRLSINATRTQKIGAARDADQRVIANGRNKVEAAELDAALRGGSMPRGLLDRVGAILR